MNGWKTATPERISARRALLRLLSRQPNCIVSHGEIVAELGREVSRQAISTAATSLRRDMAMESYSGPGGGYVLLLPVTSDGENTCSGCRERTLFGYCRRLDRGVEDDQWCYGWRAR